MATLEELENALDGLTLVADKGYDYDDLRDHVQARGGLLLSPHRSRRAAPPRDQHQIGRHYAQRWHVDRFFAWLAGCRLLTTRW